MYSLNAVSKTILVTLYILSLCLKTQSSDVTSNKQDTRSRRTERSLFQFQNAFMYEVLRQSPASRLFPLNIQGKLDFIRDQYPTPELLEEYDFVIVGAGPAGCVLANRLTDNGRWNVLLLEAGDTESTLNEIPMTAAVLEETDYAWKYPLERDENTCRAMKNNTCYFSAGKGVGGGTIVNYMIYSRGTKRDYDKMAEAGNTGWSYDEVLPYFIKSESANLQGLEETASHGKDGPLNVEYLIERTKFADAFLEGARELKQNVLDYNAGLPGFNYVQVNTRKGRRRSAAKAFLLPVRYRENLHLLTKSRVTKVHIDTVTKTARSVEYVRNKKTYKVKSRKEVILSAGAMISPKLLMLSGVGPKEHLEELNIPLIQDLKVGDALFEHVAFGGLNFLIDEPDVSVVAEAVRFGSSIFRWLNDGTGPLSMIGGIEAVGFINTNTSADHENSSDIEIILITQPYVNEVARTVLRISDDFYEEYFAPITNKRAITMVPVLLTPKSRGSVKLKDKNPFHWPKFYANLFSDERDLDTLVAGIRFTIKLSETEAFKKFGTRIYSKPFPTCKEFVFDTDDYWKCGLRSLGFNFRHQVATCKMGPDGDPEAVVDPQLRVRGIKQLRVVDASVFPSAIAGHTTAPVYMLAEKAADLIKDTWKEDF